MKKNIDLVKVTSIAGSLLTVAATLLTNYSQEKKLDETIEKKVAEAIAKQLNSTNE